MSVAARPSGYRALTTAFLITGAAGGLGTTTLVTAANNTRGVKVWLTARMWADSTTNSFNIGNGVIDCPAGVDIKITEAGTTMGNSPNTFEAELVAGSVILARISSVSGGGPTGYISGSYGA